MVKNPTLLDWIFWDYVLPSALVLIIVFGSGFFYKKLREWQPVDPD